MIAQIAFALLALQDPDLDALLKKLETAPATSRDDAIDAVVAKGDPIERAVRQRLEGASEGLKERLNLVLRRLELQRKLNALYPMPPLIDYDVRDKPLAEVVAEVEKWIGLPILRANLPEQKVTLRITGGNALQALDAFHQATGLTWSPTEDRGYDKERQIHIKNPPGARLVKSEHLGWPSCARGRYWIRALSTTLVRSDASPPASGRVQIAFQIPAASPAQDILYLTAGRIVDDKGRELAQAPGTSRPPFPRIGLSGARVTGQTPQFQFAHPAADARSISLLGGRARVGYVVERTYVTFERPEDSVGSTLECDGLKVKLKEFQPAYGWMRLVLDQSGSLDSSRIKVERFEYRGSSLLDHVEAVHEDGSITYPETQGAQGEEGVYRKRMMCFSSPKVVAIRLAVKSFFAYEDVEFDLRDIPLPGAK